MQIFSLLMTLLLSPFNQFMSEPECCSAPTTLVHPLTICHWRLALTNEMRQEQGVMNLFLARTSILNSSSDFHRADHMTPRGQYWQPRQRQLRVSREEGPFKNKSKSKLIQIKNYWPKGFWYLKAARENSAKKILHSEKSTHMAED